MTWHAYASRLEGNQMQFARKWLMGHLNCIRTKGVAMLCGQIKQSFQTYQQRHAMHALRFKYM